MPVFRLRVPPRNVPVAFKTILAGFLDWSRVDRGFSAETISTYERGIERFVTEARASPSSRTNIHIRALPIAGWSAIVHPNNGWSHLKHATTITQHDFIHTRILRA